MRTAEARMLVGKEVTWVDTICPKRGGIRRGGRILAVKGKNVLVDQQGFRDWLWLPDMKELSEATPNG